jgi:pyocin large subunit-like protein
MAARDRCRWGSTIGYGTSSAPAVVTTQISGAGRLAALLLSPGRFVLAGT